MNKTAAFWDSSALVPLCVHEAASRHAQSQLRKFMPVVWWGSVVEVHSAIMRLHRFGGLNDAETKGALTRLSLLGRTWREILPTDQVRDMAIDILDSHDLRAADSFQLSAALIWCQRRPAKRNFVCADQRLSNAANVVGFSVLELAPVTP